MNQSRRQNKKQTISSENRTIEHFALRKSFLFKSDNRGSALLPALVACVFVFIAAHQASGALFRIQQSTAQERLKVQWKNLEQAIQMLYWDTAVCKTNLIDQQPPAVAAMQGAIAGGPTAVRNVTLRYPANGGGSRPVLVGNNTQYEDLRIENATFRDATLLSANAYRLRLSVQTSPPAGSSVTLRTLDFPIYVTTSGGAVQSCYFSSYSTTNVTIEDHLCTVLKGQTSKWDGASKCL